jgi:hypothetical protein
MKVICFLIVVLFATPVFAQEKIKPFGTCANEKNLPVNLEQAMDQLEAHMSEEFRRTFKKKDPIMYHHGLGTSIRKTRGLVQSQGHPSPGRHVLDHLDLTAPAHEWKTDRSGGSNQRVPGLLGETKEGL